MRTETEEEGLVQVSLTCAGREGGGEVQAEGTATESCQTHVRVEIIAKSPETGKSDKVVKEDEGVPGDQGEAPPYGGEAGERAASGSPAGSSKSQQSSIEEWQAEIVDGLTEELNASRAKYLELEYELEKSEEAKLDRDKQILSLTTELARLREAYVALEQKTLAMQAKKETNLPRTPTKQRGTATAFQEEKDTLTRQLNKAEKALAKERGLASQLRRELDEQLAKLAAMAESTGADEEAESLQAENEVLKARLAQGESLQAENEALKARLAQGGPFQAENEALKARLAQGEEKTSLVKRTLDDSNAQCLAASSTIDKLITENVEYIDRINQLASQVRAFSRKSAPPGPAREETSSGPAGGHVGAASNDDDLAPPGVERGSKGGGEEVSITMEDVEDLKKSVMKPKDPVGFFGFITGADKVPV
ncbi:hypothetical protein HOP50_15g74900 [Chloropicon primus]|nr:hypothetical protein HOP50_15g74900 [Chloropicon primus]